MKPRMALRRGLIAAMVSALFAPAVQAWSPDGHRVVAALADRQLTPATRRIVTQILQRQPGAKSLSDIATAVDERPNTENARWRYINFPGDSCHYVAPRDCPDGMCVVEALRRQIFNLKSRRATTDQRLSALKFVIPLVADIHQPLHAGLQADHWGSLYPIRWQGQSTNLYRLWDAQLLHLIAPQWARLANSLHTGAPFGTRALGNVAGWAEESCTIARSKGFYPTHGRRITSEYVSRWAPVLEQRLQLAGWRLAFILNSLPAATAPK
jgi:hypothetical protein